MATNVGGANKTANINSCWICETDLVEIFRPQRKRGSSYENLERLNISSPVAIGLKACLELPPEEAGNGTDGTAGVEQLMLPSQLVL